MSDVEKTIAKGLINLLIDTLKKGSMKSTLK